MEMAPQNIKWALDLTVEKGSSAWLTVPPLRHLGLHLNEREFSATVKLRYDWPLDHVPSTCVWGSFTVDHSLICKIEGFVTKRHNKLRHLEAEILTVRYSVILRLSQSSKKSLENSYEEDLINRKMRDWISLHLGFRERSAFFDDRVCYPNAE